MKSLFRKEAEAAFKGRFLTNKNLSRITLPTGVMVLFLFLGIYLYFGWIQSGEIIRTTEMEGVVFPSAGIETAHVLNDGVISYVTVRPGDRVEVGDVIAIVPDDSLLSTLKHDKYIGDGSQKNEIDYESEELTRKEYVKNSFIRSPANGYVISILSKGHSVKTGDTLAVIAADGKEFGREHVLVFLPTENKNGIKKGCDVQISPDYAQREKYGYINGYVYSVSDNIITKKEALESYNFYNIPYMLEEGKTYLPVVINFDEDLNNESGLSWSLSSSGSIVPEPGTKCKCDVIIEKVKPYEWLFGGAVN